MEPSTKKSRELTLKDRLSRLTYRQTCKLLGEQGEKLIQRGGAWEIDINEHVTFNDDFFRVKLPASSNARNGSRTAIVTIELAADERDCLKWECTLCDTGCEQLFQRQLNQCLEKDERG